MNNDIIKAETETEIGLNALRQAAELAGPGAANALGDLLAEICGNDARMTDLETLVTGYRRRSIKLVAQLRARQKRDPAVLTESLKALRAEEDRAAGDLHRIESWALRILTEGEVYADATPPADWDSMRRVAEVMTTQLPRAQRAGEVAHG